MPVGADRRRVAFPPAYVPAGSLLPHMGAYFPTWYSITYTTSPVTDT